MCIVYFCLLYSVYFSFQTKTVISDMSDVPSVMSGEGSPEWWGPDEGAAYWTAAVMFAQKVSLSNYFMCVVIMMMIRTVTAVGFYTPFYALTL